MQRPLKLLARFEWFGPRRSGGWGWSPISWQGWLVMLVFLAAILWAASRRPPRLRILMVLVGAFIAICYITGGPPGMQ